MKMVKKNAVLLCWWWAQQQQQQQHSVVGFIFSASTAPLSCNLLFTSPQTTLPTPNDDPIFYASDWLFNKSPFSDFEVVVVVVLRESVTERRPALHLHRAELQGMCRLISSALLRRGAVHIIPPPHLSLCASVCVCVAVISLSFKRRIWQYTFTPCLEWNSPGSTRCTHDIEGRMNACTWKMLVLQTILSLVNA